MADWACSRCGFANSQHMSTCASCGALKESSAAGAADPSTRAQQTLQTAGGPPMAAPTFEPVLPMGVADLGLGVLAGAIAGAVAAGIWYAVVVMSGWQVGLVAIVVGLLVGKGVVFGAGGRSSLPLVAASFGLTLLALWISEYLIIYHFVSEYLGPGVIDLLQPLDVVVGVVVESLQADPLTLLFWGIALFQAVAIPFRAMR
jgi:hypothetical protein